VSRTRVLRFRATPEEEAEIKARAIAAGHADYGAWLRELALGEARAGDGRANRWAELRAQLRGLLSGWADSALAALLGERGDAPRSAALAIVGLELQLGRSLNAQEAGIAADVAAAERSGRLERPDLGEDPDR
jgi:hypothetical protein